MTNIYATAARRLADCAKADERRALADRRFTFSDILRMFGQSMMVRVQKQTRHDSVGKNFFSNHFHAGRRNPAGSKLLRRIIRQSDKEMTSTRKAYKALTGRQYDHLNNPEQ
jgi:hypothetical protein